MSYPESSSDPTHPPAEPTAAAPAEAYPPAENYTAPASFSTPAEPTPAPMAFAEPTPAPVTEPVPVAPVQYQPAPAPVAPESQPTAAMPAAPYGQPAAAAPYGQQAPAAPYGQAYQPGQASAYPVASGVPYPTSAMPTSAYPAAPAPAPAKPGKLGIILLSVLSGLLVLALAGMTTLFFVNAGDAKKKQDNLTAQLAQKDKELTDTQSQLQSKVADLAKVQQDLDGSKAATAEQTKEKEAVGKCLDLIYKALAAQTASEFNKRIKAAEKPCDEADKYVDSF